VSECLNAVIQSEYQAVLHVTLYIMPPVYSSG